MLPKISYPIINIEIGTHKKKFPFRPFLVKEEKILLMAKESESFSDILTAVKQIVNNCSLDEKLKIDDLPIFELEYIFIKIRAQSVDNMVQLIYRDLEDDQEYKFNVNLNDIKVVGHLDNKAAAIKISNESGILMKPPPASLYDDKAYLSLEQDMLFELIVRCVDKIYYKDEVYDAKDYKLEELSEFIEKLDLKTFEKITDYLTKLPKVEHVITYKNKVGTERKIVLNSLNDFFTWR